MKKTKKTTARKSTTKKSTPSKAKASVKASTKAPVKARAKSKAKIQVKAKAKSPVKRKSARKSGLLSGEDLLVQSITTREERRAVIPESAERNKRSSLGKVAGGKKVLPRKVSGKKPVFPLAHSE